MARTWNSSGSTDMNDGTNYTGAGALLTTDDLIYDATSVVNATATAALDVNSITSNAGYSGDFDMNANNLTCGPLDITGATGKWLLDGITWNADGNITWTSSANEFNLSGTTLKADANLTLTSRNEGTTRALALLDIAAGVTVTMAGQLALKNDGATNVTMTGTSTWNLAGNDIICFSIGTFSFVDNGGSIIGDAGADFLFQPPSGNLTCTLPAINDANISMTIFGVPASGETQRWNAGGNLIMEEVELIHNVGSSTGNVILDFKTFNFETPAKQLKLNIRGGTNIGTGTLNLGTGTHKVLSIGFESDVGAAIVLNYESATLEHSNTFDYTGGGSVLGSLTLNAGTSTMKYTGGSNRFLTSGGVVHNIYENGSGAGGITLVDDFAAATLTLTNGLWNTSGNGMDIGTGGFNVNTNDAITIDGAFTCAGNVVIDAAVLTFTHTGTMELDGTGVQQVTSAGESFDIIKISNTAGSVEFLDAASMTRFQPQPGSTTKKKESVNFTVSSYVSGDISGTSGNLVVFESLLAGTAANFVNPAGMSDVQFVDIKDNNATNPVIAASSTDSGGNTNWTFSVAVTGEAIVKDIVGDIVSDIVVNVVN